MRRGSLQLRLPRGRRSLKVSLPLLGVAMFLVILVPSFFYLFPQLLDSGFLQASSSDLSSRLELKSSHPSILDNSPLEGQSALSVHSSNATDVVQNAATSRASLLATVHILPDITQVYLENTGPLELHHVQITDGEKSLGILSALACCEKKVLAVSGSPRDLQVNALDPSERKISGRVQYLSPAAAEEPAASLSGEEVLSTKAAPEIPLSFSGATGATGAPSPLEPPRSPAKSALALTIVANKSEGRAGEIIGYRCTARNTGEIELSKVSILCAGKAASTGFLTAGKELYLDGAFLIENNTRLLAGVQALDPHGKVYTNNTSIDIWKISPSLDLLVSAPEPLHRGERFALQIRIENKGRENLSDILVKDSLGEIGRIASLGIGAFQVLQKEMVVSESMQDNISVMALDNAGNIVYSSQSLGLQVRSSSLRIQGDPGQVSIYPGEPAEIVWVLTNDGEELLHNITLEGDGKKRMLRELSPGSSVRMAAIYSKNTTSWINVTAKGSDGNGFEAAGTASVLLKAISPGLTIKLMPAEIEVCPNEAANVNVLVTNTGDDRLEDVALTLNGSNLATLGELQPGEFRVINSQTMITDNCTIDFEATGKDSRGQTLSNKAAVKAKVVVAALKIFVSSSPAAVVPGASSIFTCTVANTGSVPLYSVFVISKRLGPLGNVDFLSPKHQMTITSEKTINEALEDIITAEGFTQDKKPVRGTFSLSLKLLNAPGPDRKAAEKPEPNSRPSAVKLAFANITCGNTSLPFNLPAQERASSEVSRTMARDVDRSATDQENVVLDKISNLLHYVEKLLGLAGGENAQGSGNESESHAPQEFAPHGKDGLDGSRNYELSIAGVKGSEHGAITILDVNALPSQPAANEPVKVTAHIQCQEGVKSASVKYGLSDLPLTKQDMLSVDRVYDSTLALESGDAKDGYWSGTIPGRGGGVYMPLSVWITDGSSTAEGGPYLIHWSTVNSVAQTSRTVTAPSSGGGMLFIESTSVTGRGEVSIKDTIMGSTMQYNEKIIGNGSISLETMRSIDRKGSVDNFTEKKDLVFTGGNLKGHKTVASPNFQGGLGASVTERFNLSHVDKSETSSVSSTNFANNTLSFKTDQAFEGTWNIQTKYAKFYKKIKADQKYTGSFQTQKDIKFEDAGQR
jgi:hypothetical protein